MKKNESIPHLGAQKVGKFAQKILVHAPRSHGVPFLFGAKLFFQFLCRVSPAIQERFEFELADLVDGNEPLAVKPRLIFQEL